jgi:hypothetical protein
MPELSIGSILLSPVIVGIVQLLKLAKLPDKYAPWANLILSVLAYIGVYLVTQNPDMLQPVEAGLSVLVAFLVAAGVYDRTQKSLNL